MGYRKARFIWAGIGIGWTLLICLLIQVFLFLKGWDAPQETVWGFLLILFIGQSIIEYIGGYALPNKHGQSLLSHSGQWIGQYLRGLIIYLVYYAFNGYMLMLMAQTLGLGGAIGWFVIQMLMLMGFRQYLARGIHAFKTRFETNRGRPIFYMDTDDRGFTGGISGIPGQESIIFPAYWEKKFSPEVSDALLAMRHGVLNTGGHGKGFFLILLIHTALISLSMWVIPEPLGSLEWLIGSVSLYTLCMAFASLGVLPSLNRRGVIEMDRWLYYKKVDADILRKAITESRRLQNDISTTDSATSGVGLITHAAPNVQERFASLQSQRPVKGMWYIFSDWAFLSWAGLSLMNRMFPGALGIPSRWIFLPGE